MEKSYDFLIYGASSPDAQPTALQHSEGFLPTQGSTLAQAIPVHPFKDGSGSFALIRLDSESVTLAFAMPDQTRYVRIPNNEVKALKGDFKPLMRLVKSEWRVPLPALGKPTQWTFEVRREALYRALEHVGGDMMPLLALLSGCMVPEGLVVQGFKGDFSARFQIMQGLTLLVPSPFRYYMTFSTHSKVVLPNRPRLIFSESDEVNTRKRLKWGQKLLTVDATHDGQSYIQYLAQRWNGDLDAFVRLLISLDKVAYELAIGDIGLAQSVDEVAQRANQDDPNRAEGSGSLIAMLEDDDLEDDTREHTLNRLLQMALEDRDAASSHWLALQMEADPDLDDRFSKVLEALTDTQPDAVYAFVRAHLNAGGDLERWLSRLHHSARRAFAVVLESTDVATVMSWLQLLTREPEHYEMGDILHDAILGSVPLAYEYIPLARDLLIRAVKRDPSAMLYLLDDPIFRDALSVDLQSAILQHNPEAIAAIGIQSRELFLLSIARAISNKTGVVSAELMALLWELYAAHSTLVVAEAFQPLTLIRRLVGADRAALQEGVLLSLLDTMLEYRKDELFFETADLLAREEALIPTLTQVIRNSQRTVDELINLITTLTSNGALNVQSAVNLYVALLEDRQWDEKSMTPMIEQLARIMSQPNDVRVPANALWHLIELSPQMKNDMLCKGAVKRLLNNIIQKETDEQFVKDLQRLKKAIQNQPISKMQVQTWWRDFTNAQTTPQLQKLEKALDGQRGLEDLRASLGTFISVRKQFAAKSLQEWANDIATAYRVLKALSEGFDPEERGGVIDVGTIQRMMENNVTDWQSDQKHVLAANLRDLADLLPSMADARTKPSLIRNEEATERLLMTGDHAPQSAIDVMRWLAGFLDGAQKNGA